ncbi:hypothetical protein BDZ94DRAFT_1273592 [Collybia nuda]|uniref:Uncharacterized protein n=1 Tax=Collybia nuda TaxID=64659 RepID=A0A9P5XT96_9AGAR|nr:hypothetical protein BDZ94DRAFT_1273592 [Collybia nuda]
MQIADSHLSSSTLHQIIQIGTVFVLIAEHLYFVWKHKRSITAPEIPPIIALYQESLQCIKHTRQVEEAINRYLKTGTRSIKYVLHNMVIGAQVKDSFKDGFEEKLCEIVLQNKLDKVGF